MVMRLKGHVKDGLSLNINSLHIHM